MAKAYLINGWADLFGWFTMERFRPALEDSGFEVERCGYFSLLLGWLTNRFVVKWLTDVVEPHSVIVAHSNGCEIARQLSYKVPLSVIVCLNAALDDGAMFGPETKHIINVHSTSDWVLKVASWLPFSPWGDFGTKPQMHDDRIYNVLVLGAGHLTLFRRSMESSRRCIVWMLQQLYIGGGQLDVKNEQTPNSGD